MEEAYVGLEPRGRWRPSHPVRLGSPSVHNVPRVRAHASALGPLVPSETIRRYQPEDARRPGRHRERRRRLRGAHAFGASRAFVRRGCLRGQGALAPPTRLGGNGHQRGPPDPGINGVPAGRTLAREPIRHQGRAGEAAVAPEGTHPLGGPLGLGGQGRLVGHLALVPSRGVGGAPPRWGETKSFVHQCSALPRGLGGAPPLASLPPSPTSHRTAAPRPPTPSLF